MTLSFLSHSLISLNFEECFKSNLCMNEENIAKQITREYRYVCNVLNIIYCTIHSTIIVVYCSGKRAYRKELLMTR